jgi:hypothetical protein
VAVLCTLCVPLRPLRSPPSVSPYCRDDQMCRVAGPRQASGSCPKRPALSVLTAVVERRHGTAVFTARKGGRRIAGVANQLEPAELELGPLVRVLFGVSS